MLDAASFPWSFPYVDLGEQRAGIPVYRPAIEVIIRGPLDETKVWALVDSGAEHTYAGPWIARAVGCRLDPTTRTEVGIGGRAREVEFGSVSLRIDAPDGDGTDFVEWDEDVGFFDQWEPTWALLLGQRGFFDAFTVTMSRQAQGLAIDRWDAFDRRFGIRLAR